MARLNLTAAFYGGRGFSLYHAAGSHSRVPLSPHFHDEYLISAQISGNESCHVAGKLHQFCAGDVVLINPATGMRDSKLMPRLLGPYVVQHAVPGGGYRLLNERTKHQFDASAHDMVRFRQSATAPRAGEADEVRVWSGGRIRTTGTTRTAQQQSDTNLSNSESQGIAPTTTPSGSETAVDNTKKKTYVDGDKKTTPTVDPGQGSRMQSNGESGTKIPMELDGEVEDSTEDQRSKADSARGAKRPRAGQVKDKVEVDVDNSVAPSPSRPAPSQRLARELREQRQEPEQARVDGERQQDWPPVSPDDDMEFPEFNVGDMLMAATGERNLEVFQVVEHDVRAGKLTAHAFWSYDTVDAKVLPSQRTRPPAPRAVGLWRWRPLWLTAEGKQVCKSRGGPGLTADHRVLTPDRVVAWFPHLLQGCHLPPEIVEKIYQLSRRRTSAGAAAVTLAEAELPTI